MQPVVKVEDIRVSFGSIQALRGVSLEIYPGEVVALVGDNGAGKSTLIKVISGALQPDRGTICIEGEPVRLKSPAVARELGIETVYQELALAPDLDIAANLFLGKEELRPGLLGRLGFLDERRMAEFAQDTMKKLKVPLNYVGQRVETLSGGQRQSVAICRAIAWKKRLVIMDEPTAALGVEESARVLDLVREVKHTHTAALMISHNLSHVFEVADRVIVLRLGERVASAQMKETSMDAVVSWITGSSVQGEPERGGRHAN